jgi:membrane protein implicated in regulation of membrane protease activity
VWAPVIAFAFAVSLGYAALIAAWLTSLSWMTIAIGWAIVSLVAFIASYFQQRAQHRRTEFRRRRLG